MQYNMRDITVTQTQWLNVYNIFLSSIAMNTAATCASKNNENRLENVLIPSESYSVVF